MAHLSDGTLRRMVDEPLAIADSDRRHYRACSHCQEQGAQIAALAGTTARIFGAAPAPLDTARAFAQVGRRVALQGSAAHAGRWSLPRTLRHAVRPAGGVAAALALVGALALTPAGSLAQSLITIFQPQQISTVQVTTHDLRQLSGLARYGTFHAPARVHTQRVGSAAAASVASGMTVLVPSILPSGVVNAPQYQVMPGTTASFTFSAAKAHQAALRSGKAAPPMPARINGSTLQVTVGTAVAATYGTGELPDLVVGQMAAPKIMSTGVTVKELEDYVLKLPDVPSTLATQLRNLGDPTTTLPLPIPVDMAQSEKVSVQGVEGVAIGDQTGAGSVVIWEKNGMIYGVGGPLKESDVLAAANSLHS